MGGKAAFWPGFLPIRTPLRNKKILRSPPNRTTGTGFLDDPPASKAPPLAGHHEPIRLAAADR